MKRKKRILTKDQIYVVIFNGMPGNSAHLSNKEKRPILATVEFLPVVFLCAY